MSPAAPAGGIRRWIAGTVLIAPFLILLCRFWHPVYGFTPLLQLDSSNDFVKIAAFRELPVYVYRNTGGYDGLYYAQIAYHPLLDSAELRPAIDVLAYRARRILPSALAWLLAAGNPAGIVSVYCLINGAAWLALAALLWRNLGGAGAAGWIASAGVLYSAGALASVRFALTDLPAATLAAASLWAFERGRVGGCVGLMAAAGLSRETALAAIPGLWRRPWLSAGNLGRTLLAIAPLAAWLAYIRWRIGPSDAGWSSFTWPLFGLALKTYESIMAFGGIVDTVAAAATLLAMLGLGAQVAYLAAFPRPADPWWRVGAAFAFMMAFLGPQVWEGFPGASIRVLLPLTIAFNVLAARGKASAWLVAGNLGVAAGVLALLSPPNDPREVAAARSGGAAVIARVGEGWFDREHKPGHVWAWCSGHGRIYFEAWPRDSRALTLQFGIRSLDGRKVVVRERGRIVWEGAVGPARAVHSIPAALASGRDELDFSSEQPPVRESAAAGSRPLAFEIYDLRIAVPGR